MHPERVAQLTEKVQTHALTGARPSGLTDGVDTSSWRSAGYGPFSVQIYFDGSAAANVTQPTGGAVGVEVWGLKTINGLTQWWRVAILNGGNQIPVVSDTLGESELVNAIGSFDRLFVAGTASAGTINALFVPLEIIL